VTRTVVHIQAIVADLLRLEAYVSVRLAFGRSGVSRGRHPNGLLHHLQSARRSRAVGVRAATRPGQAATTLASTSAPSATRTTDTAGTLGWGTA
jgi:hypothetical protein